MASRILLADDSITIQKVVNLTFADEGIEVVAVSSGDMAERRLPEVNPDLVLADIFMPGKNGYELCEAIKENSQFQHVPVVLLVGAFEPFDQAEANRVKADAHLTKPFESRTLVDTVRRLISASEGNAGASDAAASLHDEAEEAIDALSPASSSTPVIASKPQIDFSALMPENNYPDSTPTIRSTGELASPSPDNSHSSFNTGTADGRSAHEATLNQASLNEPIEIFEFSGNGNFAASDSANAFGMDTHEMVKDFERSDVLGSAAESHDPISFHSEPNSLLDVDISGAGEGESWYSSSVYESTQGDQPPVAAEWQTTDNSAVTHSTADLSMQAEGAYEGVRESSDTACATLLAVDEPLGDVLFDEATSANRLVLSQPSASDALGFEFTESEVNLAAPEATQFDLVQAFEQPTPETSFEFVHSPAEEMAAVVVDTPVPETIHETVEAAHEVADMPQPVGEMQVPFAEVHEVAAQIPEVAHQMHQADEQAPEVGYQTHEVEGQTEVAAQMHQAEKQIPEVTVQIHEAQMPEVAVQMHDAEAQVPDASAQVHEAEAQVPVATQMHDAAAEMKEESPAPDAVPFAHDAGSDQGWATPHATEGTENFDSTAMPVLNAIPNDYSPIEPEPVMSEPTSDPSGAMWTEEETRFTPIDIEAVALEDAPIDNVPPSELNPETGFVVSSVLTEEPPAKVEPLIEGEHEEEKSAAVASDLSAAAIDQIVRRVLSQMSESVVREVAWEVVPDCVERVVEQLTRESLTKRA